MTDTKPLEYELLNEIARERMITQANLSDRLGITDGSMNWCIKQLIYRGWIERDRNTT
jgi:DNA-binding MarR family transcriptional regulator